MTPKSRGRGKSSASIGKQYCLIVSLSVFVICFMFWFRLYQWVAENHAILRANVIHADPGKELQNMRVVAPSSTLGPDSILTPHKQVVSNMVSSFEPHVATNKVTSFIADRYDVVLGYDAAMEYLANYTIPEGSDEHLFLFFVCGDEEGKQTEWKRVCVDASKLVYTSFATSPPRNKLLVIYAGSKTDWSTANAFYKDVDLKVKMIPAIMQWHGGSPGAKRATSGMIIEESLLYEPLLRYLFKNEDVPDPLVAPEKIASKEIVVLKGYTSYRLYMDTIEAGGNASVNASIGPMFLLFESGRLNSNDRLWCPYCRYSELSVEYTFYAFAPNGSRLIKVETVNSYGLWKTPTNEWREDKKLMIRGVPWLYRAILDNYTYTFSYVRYKAHFDIPEDLRGVFEGWKDPI